MYARTLAAVVLAASTALTIGETTASATAVPDEAGASRRWVPERGWVTLPEQPAGAPQEAWTADAPTGPYWRGIVVDTTYVVIGEDGGGLVFTGVDLTTGDELWSTETDLADDNTDVPLLGHVSEIGEGAVYILAYRDDDSDEIAATDPPGSELPNDDPPTEKIVIDVASGDVMWQGVEGEECCINLAVTTDHVIVDGTALDRATGDWAWHAEGEFLASGSTVMVYSPFGADEPGFGVVNPANGQLAWWQPADDDGNVNRQLYLADDTVIHARDGDDAVIEGYDRVTGTRRWRMPFSELPDELNETGLAVTALGNGLALVADSTWDLDGFGSGGAAVLDLRTGRILWEVDDEAVIGPGIDDGGNPIVLRRDEEGYSALDGRTGDVVGKLPCDHAGPGLDRILPVSGGVVCSARHGEGGDDATHRGTVTMWDFDGTERWTVELAGELFYTVIPRGFVAGRAGADGRAEMVAYTG
ncbi:MAG: PQQ-binding-like beta-propeller repeat protein [Acidimicrobiales bacterium]